MDQQLLLPPNLSELIPGDDPVRVVNRVVNQLDQNILYKPFTRERGQPPYHPAMMMKLLIYGYTQKVYSCRRLEKATKRDINFMWLCAYQQPDFITINRFRGKYFKKILEEVFTQVVLILLEEGYIKGEEYFVDGTKLKADANKYKVVWKKNTERYKDAARRRASEIINEANELNDLEISENLDSESLAQSSEKIENSIDESRDEKKVQRRKKSLSKKLKTESEKVGKYENQEKIPEERNSYSLTDTDATFMRMKNDETLPAYNLQVGTENGFVLGVSVHQTANDGKVFKDHMEKRNREPIGKPKTVIADAGYGYRRNYEYLDSNEIEACVKYPGYWAEEKDEKKNRYKYYKFKMNEAGEIHCPAGHRMRREDDLLHFDTSNYMCDFCSNCPAKTECIGQNDYKVLQVNRHYRHQRGVPSSLTTGVRMSCIGVRRRWSNI